MLEPEAQRGTFSVGIVLAAGAGRRFGGPKIAAAEGAWLTQAIDALREGGCDRVGVCMGALILDLPFGVVGVSVPDWELGMSASVRAAIEHAQALHADRLVLHVVDTPDVGPAVVARVLAASDAAVADSANAGARSGPDACARQLARAAYEGVPGHPVVIGRDHFAALTETLAGDEGGRTYLTGRPELVVIECADLASGADHDTR